MLDTNYASANTIIRIKEREFLTPEQWEQLLRADDLLQALNFLKNTVYSTLDVDFEKGLQQYQVDTYTQIATLIDDTDVHNVFTLNYVYHNLKVIIKEKVMNMSLSHLLVPIGQYDVVDLKHFVQTGESHILPTVMTTHIESVLDNYRHYENIQAIDVMLDEAYFAHLLQTVKNINDDALFNLVQLWIDMFNITTILRLQKGVLSRSQLIMFLCHGGHLTVSELIDLAMTGQISEIINKLSSLLPSSQQLAHDVLASGVEQLKDIVTHHHLQNAKYEAFGFLPLLAYVFYKEMEIKNLRLILTGKDNQMDNTLLRERMKPTYVV